MGLWKEGSMKQLIEQTKSKLLLVMCQSKIFEILAELSVQVTLF
jgi:hypothetical protein